MFNRKKGFTLIELLVVIAIIGILATIVLINLGSARDKAKNAAIKAALSEARAAAEMVYDTAGGSYAAICADAEVVRIGANIAANGGTFACFDTATAYCAQSPLIGTGAGFWCVDNKGISQLVTTTQCTADGADCTP